MTKLKDIIENISHVSLGTWIRLVLLIITMANMGLQAFGVNIIPVGSEQVSAAVSIAFAVSVALTAYWKNNSFTEAAQAADEVLKNFRSGEYE